MFTGELLESQIYPANRMCQWKKLLLGLPQGAGKTVVSIAAAEKLFELGLASTCIILAPPGIAWQWKEKIEEFTDHKTVHLVTRDEKTRDYTKIPEVHYLVIPYSIFRRDFQQIWQLNADIIVADECQVFSNFRSKTFKLIWQLKAQYQWALSGTAISNKLEELYAIMEWVNPKILPPWEIFEERHIVRNPNTKQIVSYKGIEELHAYLKATCMVRIPLAELKLPPLVEIEKYIDMSPEVETAERELYAELLESRRSNIQFDPEVSTSLHEARKAVSSGTKLSYAKELTESILEEADENRVVIFSFYKAPLYELAESMGRRCSFFTGDQSAEDKQQSVAEFKAGTSKVLLCSNAGAAGLDLPFANYVIHLDVPYSYGIMDQRSKRIQRTSSTFATVFCYYLMVRDSIEEYFYAVTRNKGKLAKAALEGGSDGIVMKEESLTKYLERRYG